MTNVLNKLRENLGLPPVNQTTDIDFKMTLEKANLQLESLENEYNYWLEEKELALSIVLPKATDIRTEVVDGGKRTDKMFKYISIMDDKQIDETLDYITKRKEILMDFIDRELRILDKYDNIAKKIYELRQKGIEWWKIAKIVGLCERQCRRIYKSIINRRYID